MNIFTYRRLEEIEDARFWAQVSIRLNHTKLMTPLRKVTGGKDPLFEGWLIFTGQDDCPWYDSEMKKYDRRKV